MDTTPAAALPPAQRPPATRPPARRLVAPGVLGRWEGQPFLPLEDPPGDAPGPQVPPEVARAARALSVALVEALAGRRPLAQVRSVADGVVLSTLVNLARSGIGSGLFVRSLRVQHPSAATVEVALRIGDAERSYAAALQLERRDGGWRCTALEVALPDARFTRCAA